MKNNFLITGFGRSGTKFLATHMNKSKKWTVKHEPRRMYDEDLYRTFHPVNSRIENYFHGDYYGEVNSMLRWFIDDLPINKLGIIIRDPKEIFTSCINRTDSSKTNAWSIHGAYTHFFLDNVNAFYIRFKDMVTDHDYLKKVFSHFDITDVDVSKVNLDRKINMNREYRYNTFDDIPDGDKEYFYEINEREEFINWDVLTKELYTRCEESM